MKGCSKHIISVLTVFFVFNSCSKNSDRTFKDHEGNDYRYIKIAYQYWMIDNLNVSSFQNGDPIPEAKSEEEWEEAGRSRTPAWCYHEKVHEEIKNGSPDLESYGKLYNWYAVNDPRGLAPPGWKIPSNEDWDKLELFIGKTNGNQLKSTEGWLEIELGDSKVNNQTGFDAKPGGYRNYIGKFEGFGTYAAFWTSSEKDNVNAYYIYLSNSYDLVNQLYFGKEDGMSVRCIRKR